MMTLLRFHAPFRISYSKDSGSLPGPGGRRSIDGRTAVRREATEWGADVTCSLPNRRHSSMTRRSGRVIETCHATGAPNNLDSRRDSEAIRWSISTTATRSSISCTPTCASKSGRRPIESPDRLGGAGAVSGTAARQGSALEAFLPGPTRSFRCSHGSRFDTPASTARRWHPPSARTGAASVKPRCPASGSAGHQVTGSTFRRPCPAHFHPFHPFQAFRAFRAPSQSMRTRTPLARR